MLQSVISNVVHVLCPTREYSEEEPYRVVEHNMCEGTAFPCRLPMFDSKIVFITNFHVVESCRNRTLSLATASRGRERTKGHVVYCIPTLDIAILEQIPDEDQRPLDVQPMILESQRVAANGQNIFTVGFPEGLNCQRSDGVLSGRSPEHEDMLCCNLSLNSGNS